MSKKVLVTGADGFIGSHLVEELVRQGRDVKAFVYYNSFNSWGWLDEISEEVRNEIEVVPGDVRDPFGVKDAVKGCDSIFHLAALIAIPYSYISPMSYVDTNVAGTLNIVQAARDLEARVVHTSTSEVYGTADYVPIDEKHPLKGQSPYSASKIGADQIAFSFYNSFNTPVSIIRPFNTYGPRQSARAVIPTVISQIASGKREIEMGSLSPTRDFNFVEDTVAGFLAIEKEEKTIGKVINIGSNYEVSIGDLIHCISEVMGADVTVKLADERVRPEKSEVERLWADNSLSKELLDWQPKYGEIDGLKRGLKITADWFSNPENLKKYKVNIYNV